jgi:hypothetical protein
VISFFERNGKKTINKDFIENEYKQRFQKGKKQVGASTTLYSPKPQLHKQLYNLRRKQLGNNQTKEKRLQNPSTTQGICCCCHCCGYLCGLVVSFVIKETTSATSKEVC